MEPIISPWFIYALGVVDNFSDFAVASAVILSIACVIWLGITLGMWGDDCLDSGQAKKSLRWNGLGWFVVFFFWLIYVSIPSSKTMMGMYAASVATPDNISSVVGAGKSFKDEVKQDIIDLMEHGLETKKPIDK